MSDPLRHVKLTRVDHRGVNFWSHGSTMFFDNESWEELSRMIQDFNATGVRSMQNFSDLPTRTPLHANASLPPTKKSTLDDLI